jgi:hypothetical protein
MINREKLFQLKNDIMQLSDEGWIGYDTDDGFYIFQKYHIKPKLSTIKKILRS